MNTDDVRAYVEQNCFSPRSGNVGAEVEWIVLDRADITRHTSFAAARAATSALEPFASGNRITWEPGGQLELSSAPFATAGAVCDAVATDLAAVRRALLARGMTLGGIGLDPAREDRRVLDTPRYAAMEAYFDSAGPDGRRMMCRTASIQVNVDGGTNDIAARWRRAHAIGPMLAAVFANSPFIGGRPTGWLSARLGTWWAMDRSRTAPVRATETPADAWTRYALRARVMLIRAGDGDYVPVPSGMTFERWMDDGHDLGYPTLDDFAYHLTTLFPPVRARGWLELRMIDALPDPWWRVAVAVPAALLEDAEAADAAERACRGTETLWTDASRFSLTEPNLARAAIECFRIALDALPRIGADATTIAAAAAFFDRYVARGRCPADDLLQAYHERGALPVPAREPIWI
ncbi:MAG: ergothioneine biosynthesis glutamate--cysteine ligase EgtA [Actinomycetota bacterium]